VDAKGHQDVVPLLNLDLRQVRYFVVVGEELHFGRAASRLCLSQPALSQAVRRLERSVGCDLLARSSRAVALTRAGEAFLEEARILLAQAERTVGSARVAAGAGPTYLRLGYGPALPDTARHLADIHKLQHPSIGIDCREAPTEELLAAVREGTLDGAFVSSYLAHDWLPKEPVRDVPVACLVDESHPLADRSSVSLAEIASYPMPTVDTAKGMHWRAFVLELFEDLHLRPRFVAGLEHAEGLVPGGPLVWLVSQEFSAPGARAVPIDPPRYVSYEFVWNHETASAALELFVDELRTVRDREGWLRRVSTPVSRSNA